MEFEENKPAPEEQLLSADRKMVVNPLSRVDQIEVEQSGAEIAAAHANGPAIGNFSGDIEATGNAAVAEQKATQLLALHKAANPTKKPKFPMSVVVVLVMIGVLLFALLYK